MRLQQELQQSTRAFVRSGGKTNRRMQLRRMQAFVNHCRQLGATSLNNIGIRHYRSYYEEIDHLSPSTQLNHYYAIRQLLRLNLLPDPPRPNLK